MKKKSSQKIFKNIAFSDIIFYHLSLSGYISILHRISGVILFLLLPFFILPEFSESINSYQTINKVFKQPFYKFFFVLIMWGYIYHILSGIRHLGMDMKLCIDKNNANKTAVLVFSLSSILTFIMIYKLFFI